jgi:putative transposase
MGLTRSTFYDASPATLPDDGILARISTICDEFECYGYRRVGAALRHQGVVVNGKKHLSLATGRRLEPHFETRCQARPNLAEELFDRSLATPVAKFTDLTVQADNRQLGIGCHALA